MSEQLHNLTLNADQMAAVTELGNETLQTMDARYGTGFPHFEGGAEANLGYHNGYHARTVAEDGVKVGEALGFSAAELVTTDLAGKGHDIVQLKPRGIMESESAAWLINKMAERGLPSVMAEAGALAILGTEPVFEDGKLVGQVATRQDYPTKSAERVGLAVGSGDFGRMLSPIGPLLSHRLYQQIKGCAPGQNPPMGEDFERFLAAQTTLREHYRFPLAAAEQILGKHRSRVITYGEEILRQVQRGDLESWEQLQAQDLAFMRSLAHEL